MKTTEIAPGHLSISTPAKPKRSLRAPRETEIVSVTVGIKKRYVDGDDEESDLPTETQTYGSVAEAEAGLADMAAGTEAPSTKPPSTMGDLTQDVDDVLSGLAVGADAGDSYKSVSRPAMRR